MRPTLKAVFGRQSDARHVPDELPASGASGMSARYPPGSEPGTPQYRAHEDSPCFGTQNAEAPPVGNTFQEPMGSASQGGSMGDTGADMPHLWPPSSSGNEEADMAGVRSRWEARHPGQLSPWDNFKDAVRHGWNRISPGMDDKHVPSWSRRVIRRKSS